MNCEIFFFFIIAKLHFFPSTYWARNKRQSCWTHKLSSNKNLTQNFSNKLFSRRNQGTSRINAFWNIPLVKLQRLWTKSKSTLTKWFCDEVKNNMQFIEPFRRFIVWILFQIYMCLKWELFSLVGWLVITINSQSKLSISTNIIINQT